MVTICNQKLTNSLQQIINIRSMFINKTPNNSTDLQTYVYQLTCVNWQSQLKSGELWVRKRLLPACPCWRQQPHFDYGEHLKVLFNANVTYIICEPPTVSSTSKNLTCYQWSKQTLNVVVKKCNMMQHTSWGSCFKCTPLTSPNQSPLTFSVVLEW